MQISWFGLWIVSSGNVNGLWDEVCSSLIKCVISYWSSDLFSWIYCEMLWLTCSACKWRLCILSFSLGFRFSYCNTADVLCLGWVTRGLICCHVQRRQSPWLTKSVIVWRTNTDVSQGKPLNCIRLVKRINLNVVRFSPCNSLNCHVKLTCFQYQ